MPTSNEEKIIIKISQIEKKFKGQKLVVCVLSFTLLCAINGATVESTLFEDNDGANTFCTFNPTQAFLNLKKKIVIDPLRSAGQNASYSIIT